MAHQVRILGGQQHRPVAGVGNRDCFARIMDLPDHPANPSQLVVPERQMIHRECAFDILDHISAVVVPAQRLGNIHSRRPERAKVALHGG